MLPREIVAVSLVAIWGAVGLLWHGVDSYWEERLVTPARRRELKIEKESRPPGSRRRLRVFIAHSILVGIPLLFAPDALGSRIGVLYSSQLSFFSPFDIYIQAIGLMLSIIGLVIAYGVGRILVKEVYSKAREERKMMNTGIYAYVRHPFYVHFLIIPIGLTLLTPQLSGYSSLPGLCPALGIYERDKRGREGTTG